MEYAELYGIGREKLKAAGIDECDNDARLLLEFVCDTDRATLLSHPERSVSSEEEERFLSFIERRAARIPLQHLTGTTCFMGLDFKVNENVLIPRFDTEILVEEALKYRNDGDRILDICTGSGCILISLLKYSNGCEGLGVDISKDALEVATQNAEAILSDKEDETSFSFIRSDLYENVSGKFDIIVSNPPYMIQGHGLVNDSDAKLIARHEISCTFEDIARVSSHLLKAGGKLFLVHRPFRLSELFVTMTRFGIEPKRLRLVHPFIDQEPNLALIEGVKGGRSRLTVEPPLIVYEKEGVYSDEIYRIYKLPKYSAAKADD